MIRDVQTGTTDRYDAERAARRYLPASTFKVYNALVALETGVVADPDSVFEWDGVTRSYPPWNQDHTLRTGLELSVVWLYQRVAREVGHDRYRAAFARQPYGNGAVGDDVGLFWLDNTLQVSADEQVDFLTGLHGGTLAFRPEVQATVVQMMPLLATDGDAVVVGKTGLGFQADGQAPLGWIVGYVERDDWVAVFAMNAEPDPTASVETEMIPARLRIVRAILEADGWIAAENQERP